MKWRNNFGVLGVFLLVACNKAPIGFQAPTGSTVELTSITSATDGQDTYFVATVKVKVTSAEDGTVPGNNIFVTMTCTKCTLFDRAEGENATVADPARVGEVSNPYSFATNSSGNYQVVIKVEDPADLGVASYTAKIVADIGVALVEKDVTVGTATEETSALQAVNLN